MKKVIVLLLFSAGLTWAADPPKDWVGAGASYAQPQVSGWGAYAKLLSTSGPIYSFSEITFTMPKGKLQTTTTTGVATDVFNHGRLKVFGFGNVGAATSAATTSAAYAGGGVGIYELKNGFNFAVGAQFLHSNSGSQTIYSFGVGKSF